MTVQIQEPALRPAAGSFFAPNSWAQQQALVTTAPEVLYSGRYGSSKSRTLTEKADIFCRQYPGSRVVLARKRRTDLGLTTLRILLEQTITPSHAAWGWKKSSDGGSALYYPNGSEILAVGLDEPLKLKSGEFDLVLIDQAEEIDEEEWNAAAGRLRRYSGPYRQIMGACNPDSPVHFLFKKFQPTRSHRIWSKEPLTLPNGQVLPPGQLVAEAILAGAHDNMENLGTDYLARLARYKGRYYQRYVLGLWVAFEGQVYDCWDESVHVVQRPKEWAEWGGYPPASWPRYKSTDFGYVNPFVHQWWADDPEGRRWLYQEIYYSHRTVSQHSEQIRSLEARELAALNEALLRRGEKPMRYLDFWLEPADHDAEDRATMELHDIATIPANKDVSAGIQTVYDLMVPYQKEPGAALDARLKFVEDAVVERDPYLENEGFPTCTIEEVALLRYRNPPKSSTLGRVQPEDVFKEHDHGCDAMRYMHHTRKSVGTVEVVRV